MTAVLGSGPIAITTAAGAHLTVPLSALRYDGTAVTVSGWPPPPQVDHGENALAAAWATYLLNTGTLSADTATTPASGPAFLVEAVDPGLMGNAIKLTISNVHPVTPARMSTLDLEVEIVDTYKLQTQAGLKDTIGIAPAGGTRPGLVYADDANSPLTDLPLAATVAMVGTPPKATFNDNKTNSKVVLTLLGGANGAAADTFDAIIGDVDPTPPGTFTLTTHWHKKVTGKTLADMAVAFAAVIKITAPPGGFGTPAESAGVPLVHGADAGVVNVAPQPATLTVPTA